MICFKLPADLAGMLVQLEENAYISLAEHGHNNVFLDNHGVSFLDGQGIDTKKFDAYWHRIIQASGACFSARTLRHIFVAERRGPGRVEGPDDAAAAMIMGHSIKQWDLAYDKNYERTLAQAAVDNMQMWRDNLCHQPVPEVQQQPNAVLPAPLTAAPAPAMAAGLPQVEQPHAADASPSGSEPDDGFVIDLDEIDDIVC